MPELLCIRQHTYTVTYQINNGKENGTVAIHFINGKFDHADFPFSGKYSRYGWRILAAIEAEITRLEGEMAVGAGEG